MELTVFSDESFMREALKEAQKAYSLYRDIAVIGFTGSGGTRLPDDVQLQLKELHDLAYGVPQVKSGI